MKPILPAEPLPWRCPYYPIKHTEFWALPPEQGGHKRCGICHPPPDAQVHGFTITRGGTKKFSWP